MKARIVRIGVVLGAVLAAFAFFVLPVSFAAPGQTDVSWQSTQAATARVDPGSLLGEEKIVIESRRYITPTAGIDSPLIVSFDGEHIFVTGHINCDGGESFDLQVRVRQQDGLTAVARGSTADACTSGEHAWFATATTRGRPTFAPGEAEVCATARVRDVEGAPAVLNWCRSVTLIH